MINLILENDCYEQDIPEDLQNVLKHKFIENREYWFCFFSAFIDSQREETIKRFLSLPPGSNIVCHTTMADYVQLELLTNLLGFLMKHNIKLNVYIYCFGLDEKIRDYLDQHESRIVPDTPEYNNDVELREKFKEDMNKKVLAVIEYHNVYEMNGLCQYPEYFERGIKKISKELILNKNSK